MVPKQYKTLFRNVLKSKRNNSLKNGTPDLHFFTKRYKYNILLFFVKPLVLISILVTFVLQI